MKKRVKENQKGEKIKEMQEYKIIKNSYKGITLIALVITIIVLLILASVSIAMLTGDNGILTRAGDAKIETAVGAVKEQIGLYQIENKMDNKEVTPENLLAEGKVSRTVQAGEADKYYMYYALKENSFEGMQGLGKGNIASLKDVFLIDDNLNVKYISTNGKEYGDTLNNKVLEDETEIKFSSKAFSEYVSKISGVTEEEMKFKWMKNQTSLTIADPNVNSLQDLVFFPNLEKIIIQDLKIKTIEGIENCSKLHTITLIGTNIKNFMQLSNLNELTYIELRYGDNNVKDFIMNIKKLPILKTLSLNYAGGEYDYKIIKELPISLINLTIRGAKNKIDKVEGIERLTNLTELRVDNNEINTITGIEKLKYLKILDLSNNQIVDITPLKDNISLAELNLKGNSKIDGNRNNYTGERLIALNKIGEILDRKGNIYLDVDKLGLFTNYKKLDLSNQNLTTLEPLEGLTELTSLVLTKNQLTLEDEKSQKILKNMTKLEILDLRK